MGTTADILFLYTPCPGSPENIVYLGPTAGVLLSLTPCPGSTVNIVSTGPTAGVLFPFIPCPGGTENMASKRPTASVLFPLLLLTPCPESPNKLGFCMAQSLRTIMAASCPGRRTWFLYGSRLGHQGFKSAVLLPQLWFLWGPHGGFGDRCGNLLIFQKQSISRKCNTQFQARDGSGSPQTSP